MLLALAGDTMLARGVAELLRQEPTRPLFAEHATLVTPHWARTCGLRRWPTSGRRREALVDAGATLVVGHSAHVFQGVAPPVLYTSATSSTTTASTTPCATTWGYCSTSRSTPGSQHRGGAAAPGLRPHADRRTKDAELIARYFAARCASEGTGVQADRRRLIVTRT